MLFTHFIIYFKIYYHVLELFFSSLFFTFIPITINKVNLKFTRIPSCLKQYNLFSSYLPGHGVHYCVYIVFFFLWLTFKLFNRKLFKKSLIIITNSRNQSASIISVKGFCSLFWFNNAPNIIIFYSIIKNITFKISSWNICNSRFLRLVKPKLILFRNLKRFFIHVCHLQTHKN